MNDLVNISVGNAATVAVLGYFVVFFGLVLLMIVVFLTGSVMYKRAKNKKAVIPAAAQEVKATFQPAPGTAGQLKLYGTDPRDAAMIMAIVADELKVPLNELRFTSIKEINKNEI